MFGNKGQMTGIAMKQLAVAQLPFIAFLTPDLPVPQPRNIEQNDDQHKVKKFCESDPDHLPPPF
jgi:hypothetical protein